ncbi:hypothetical protein N0K08_11945 [Acidovorax sp. Be4]|uniref:DUF3800 domain-containing protein n=1 Tax=Acidovorax bellezanensis TaxID=2976702 RepID=A0ABT2PNB0_9BURK|nr:hypothetical protein [Acidovorax sp. Be4]MCT9811351.1 hypothetical protein [Acidovorax sp. Be4]
MKKMVLVLDESGAKGYAKTRERYEGEIGVMAGFLYTESEIRNTEIYLDNVLNRYRNDSGKKFHITDLDKKSQANLRDEIFHFMERYKFRWFYQAVYAEGFHQSEFSKGRGGDENGNESLHVKLFQHMFIMGLSMANLIGIKKINLTVKTDRIDKGILKIFKQVGVETLGIILGRDRDIFRYVPDDEPGKFKKEHAILSIKSDGMPIFEEIQFDIECEYSSLTIMADILANSVHHYLNKAQKSNLGIFLNNKEVLKEHPVIHLAIASKNEEHIPPMLDIIYRRTKEMTASPATPEKST